MKNHFLTRIIIVVSLALFPNNVFSQNNVIKFYTDGQKYGVADLDYFWLSKAATVDSVYFKKNIERCDSSTVGKEIWRSNAKDLTVWGQFGTIERANYPQKSGSIWFFNISGKGINYIKIRYSKHSDSTVPIQIFINNKKQAEFIPKNQANWNKFAETDWIKIKL